MMAFARSAGGLLAIAVFVSLLLVGFIGMYRLWKPAPRLFLSAFLFASVSSPLLPPPRLVLSGWEVMFEGLGTLLAGLIFGVAVLGPAKPLFQRRASG